ncbi:hypothetical protein LTR85_009832 [Meristemomyces frigidus]|nr:hypothetical protein LTR85_009832 [Meristemomyces frigidus]
MDLLGLDKLIFIFIVFVSKQQRQHVKLQHRFGVDKLIFVFIFSEQQRYHPPYQQLFACANKLILGVIVAKQQRQH